MIYKIVAAIVKFATGILCRIDAPDIDTIPERGPLIVISNHTGQLEVAVFFGLLQPRPITGWAKMEAWDNSFLNWLFNLWGLIPVRRGEGDTSALRKAIKALEAEYVVTKNRLVIRALSDKIDEQTQKEKFNWLE